MLGIGLFAPALAAGVLFLTGAFSADETAAPVPVTALRLTTDSGHVYDRPVTTSSPVPTPAPTEAPAVLEPPLGNAPFQLVIPDIGVNAPVNTYGMDANYVPEVPYNGYEVAWYDWSARPGTGGNAVMAGHVTWGGAGVFYNLDQLQRGDQIVLRGTDGVELSYEVEDNVLVDPNDPSSLVVMAATNEDVITVITCGGTFFSLPGTAAGGDYTDRRVVRARLLTGPDAVPGDLASAR
jgi:LPXTG-site transpeptidase (sortase) family protein